MLHLVEARGLAELAPYRESWAELLAATPGGSFFQSFDWLETYWRHFGAGQRLRVLIGLERDRPIAILPLGVRREATRLGPVRVCGFPLAGWGPWYGPLGRADDEFLAACFRQLHRAQHDWDLLELRWLDERIDRGRLAAALAGAGLPCTTAAWEETSEIDLAAGWDAYWASRTSKWRNNVGRNEKRLAAQGAVEFVAHRPVAEDDPLAWRLYDECVAVAAASWQAGSHDGTTLSHRPVAAFLRDAHRAAVCCRAAAIYLLRVAGRPVAFAYNYVYGGRMVGVRMGYDPAWRAAGPGSVLMRRMIEDACRRGDQRFDLGEDHAQCKRPWRSGVQVSQVVRHYRPLAPRAQLLRLKRWLWPPVLGGATPPSATSANLPLGA